jgi:hypothetical protein
VSFFEPIDTVLDEVGTPSEPDFGPALLHTFYSRARRVLRV